MQDGGRPAGVRSRGGDPANAEARATELRARLQRLRVRDGLTQAALAQMLGVSVASVLRWEHGSAQPRAAARRRIDLLERAGDARLPQAVSGPPLDEILGGPRGSAGGVTGAARLPAARTALIGREHDAAETARAVRAGRLVTLTGAAGAGKTRLALAVADALQDAFADGVWFVDLAPISDAAFVPRAVTAALGVRDRPGHTLEETLVAALTGRTLLLVLDNCEHLVEDSATLADRLLDGCPTIHLLLTGREPLGVAGEQIRPVAPLPLADAVQLFAERARAQDPSFVLSPEIIPGVERLCRRLDGLPLAIELAAARVRLLTVEQIVAHLDDRFHLLAHGSRTAMGRHQSLAAAVAWSVQLLDDEERRLFMRLSVFAGRFSLEAAAWIAAEEHEAGGEPHQGQMDVLDRLGRLVEKSLIVAEAGGGAMRYRYLETLRAYGQERLRRDGGLDEARRRHTEYCVALAEAAEPHLRGPRQLLWLERLEDAYDDMRDVLARAASGDDVEIALRLSGALWQFWETRGRLTEGAEWLERALARSPDLHTAARAKALLGAGALRRSRDESPAARPLFDESLALSVELGDRRGAARALNNLANLDIIHGAYDRARAGYERSAALARESGDSRGAAVALGNLGNVAAEQGDLTDAAALFEESLAVFRRVGDQQGAAHVMNELGRVRYWQENPHAARALITESLAIRRGLGDRRGVAACLSYAGLIARRQGELALATSCAEEAMAESRAVAFQRGVAFAFYLRGLVAADSGSYVASLRSLHEAMSVRAAIGANPELADVFEELVRVAILHGWPERAVRAAGAAAAMRARLGAPRVTADHPDYESLLDTARVVLGPVAYAAAWTAGWDMPAERAIAEVAAWSSPAGAAPVPEPTPGPPTPAPAPPRLTPREGEVLALLARGHSTKEIAHELVLSARTVERHLANLYAKLGARNRAEAIVFALRAGSSLSRQP